jgi:hypothetical protein
MTERKPRKKTVSKQRSRRRSQPRRSWRQHAGFSVFFDRSENEPEEWQTRVYDGESGEEVVFPGADLEACVGWISAHAGVPEQREEAQAAKPAASPAGEEPGEIDLEVSDVMLSENVQETSLEKTLSAELRFNLSGTKARDTAERHTPFRVETYAVDLESGDPKLVASEEGELHVDLESGDPKLVASEEGELQEAVFEYSTEQVFPVPELGRYELHTLVVLLPPEEAVARHRGPVIEVVP